MDDGRIPKDVLYGELAIGTRPSERPTLRYKDVCKRDLKVCSVSSADLESATSDRATWRSTVTAGVLQAEERRKSQWEERRTRRRQRLQAAPIATTTNYTCSKCQRTCSRTDRAVHSKRREEKRREEKRREEKRREEKRRKEKRSKSQPE
ncbi:protein SREK1IP1-like [Patiria miniata]|uniref:Uncharacterized protein n=1 Tax=Patiria miniata TaxID=46514 RepID=A0A913ZU02_PATMI|nr:protein SREK1IP1-like [Patiria miniata]